MRIFAVTLLMLAFAPSYAFAGSKFSLAGAVEHGGFNSQAAGYTTVKGGLGFGGGAFLELGSKTIGLELGGLFLARSTVTETTVPGLSTSVSAMANWIEAPALIRLSFSPVVSVGVGGFYARCLEAGEWPIDYGLQGGFRFSIPGSSMAFFFEPRFSYSLTDDWKYSGRNNMQILGLVGVTFGK